MRYARVHFQACFWSYSFHWTSPFFRDLNLPSTSAAVRCRRSAFLANQFKPGRADRHTMLPNAELTADVVAVHLAGGGRTVFAKVKDLADPFAGCGVFCLVARMINIPSGDCHGYNNRQKSGQKKIPEIIFHEGFSFPWQAEVKKGKSSISRWTIKRCLSTNLYALGKKISFLKAQNKLISIRLFTINLSTRQVWTLF